MIVITGAAGFIGSAIAWMIDTNDIDGIVAVDEWGADDRWKNLRNRRIQDFIPKDEFFTWVSRHEHDVDAIIHMGAINDTMYRNVDYLLKNNYGFSKKIWKFCVETQKRLIYASSASVYGDGSLGFSSEDDLTPRLVPLNPYGYSKLIFDRWALDQPEEPSQWVGLRFFNVYGPNERHKAHMASMVCQGYDQIEKNGKMFLFKGDGQVPDGGHRRDFVYVKDVCRIVRHFLDHDGINGIFNVGTGDARTFNELGGAIFKALNREPAIQYVDMPDEVAPNYQSYTQADISCLRGEGEYAGAFTPLEDGVREYVLDYLQSNTYL